MIWHEDIATDTSTIRDTVNAKAVERSMYSVMRQKRFTIASIERQKEQRRLIGLKDLKPRRSVGH